MRFVIAAFLNLFAFLTIAAGYPKYVPVLLATSILLMLSKLADAKSTQH
jgi:hypothetical protein